MEGRVHPFLPVHTHLLVFDTGFLWDPGTAQLPVHMEGEDTDSSAPQGTGRNFRSLAGNTAAYVGTNPSGCVLKAGSESNPCKSSNTALWQARLRKTTQNPIFPSLSSYPKAQES